MLSEMDLCFNIMLKGLVSHYTIHGHVTKYKYLAVSHCAHIWYIIMICLVTVKSLLLNHLICIISRHHVVYFLHLHIFMFHFRQDFFMEANNMNSDHTAPKEQQSQGSRLIWIHIVCNIGYISR